MRFPTHDVTRFDKLVIPFFIGCLVATGINGNDQNKMTFSHIYDYEPGFQPDIFRRCYIEAGIPLTVALGDTFKWSYMCSPDYYRTCKNELPAALTVVAQLTPDQRDIVMQYLLSWVNGGAPHLCNLGLEYVLGLKHNYGDTCLKTISKSEIVKCNLKMNMLTTGFNYSPLYCRSLDSAIRCYLEAIVPCADDKLDTFLRDFFESVVWDSPCSRTGPFGNAAISLPGTSFLTIGIAALILTLISSFMLIL